MSFFAAQIFSGSTEKEKGEIILGGIKRQPGTPS
jgi:hypothetical protein